MCLIYKDIEDTAAVLYLSARKFPSGTVLYILRNLRSFHVRSLDLPLEY
jgi:hypothetical protein